jgi:hypothetical protein
LEPNERINLALHADRGEKTLQMLELEFKANNFEIESTGRRIKQAHIETYSLVYGCYMTATVSAF